MRDTWRHRIGPWAAAALLLLAACGDRDALPEATVESAEATLSEASAEIQDRVRKTCERWHDGQGGCDSDAVYADVLSCWLEKGLPVLQTAIDNGVRPRQRNRRTVMHHSLCMERRGWRLVPDSGGYF